jgi:hypothetical protein
MYHGVLNRQFNADPINGIGLEEPNPRVSTNGTVFKKIKL